MKLGLCEGIEPLEVKKKPRDKFPSRSGSAAFK